MMFLIIFLLVILIPLFILFIVGIFASSKDPCFFGHNLVLTGSAVKFEDWHKKDPYTGKAIPGSDFKKTLYISTYKCTKCNGVMGEKRYNNAKNTDSIDMGYEELDHDYAKQLIKEINEKK